MKEIAAFGRDSVLFNIIALPLRRLRIQKAVLSVKQNQICKQEDTLMIHILVVEDDVKLNQIVCTYLNDSGFQLGIDDYMVKPVELGELLLRVRALLRRANIETERKITVGNLLLDADAMSAEVDGEEISLTTREFNIIYKLLSYPKKTFSRAQLMDEFWGIDSGTSLRAVDVYVTKLRDKLSGCDGFKIVTVRGLGYKVVLQ